MLLDTLDACTMLMYNTTGIIDPYVYLPHPFNLLTVDIHFPVCYISNTHAIYVTIIKSIFTKIV